MNLFRRIYSIIGPIGWAEMMVALLLILVRYNIAGIPLALLAVIVIDLVVVLQGGRLRLGKSKALFFLLVYWLLHDIVWVMITNDVPN